MTVTSDEFSTSEKTTSSSTMTGASKDYSRTAVSGMRTISYRDENPSSLMTESCSAYVVKSRRSTGSSLTHGHSAWTS